MLYLEPSNARAKSISKDEHTYPKMKINYFWLHVIYILADYYLLKYSKYLILCKNRRESNIDE